MKLHRFDPFSFVVGLATIVAGGMLLWGDLDVPDLRPSRLWPLPVFALGLLFTLYGVRRLVESARAHEAEVVEADEAEVIEAEGTDSIGGDASLLDPD